MGTLGRRLSIFCGPALLVIDEIGFLALDAHQANLLFQVVSRRYEQGSVILTSNKSYGEWAEVFSGDAVIAADTLDRLLHHSTTITIKGESSEPSVHGLARHPVPEGHFGDRYPVEDL